MNGRKLQLLVSVFAISTLVLAGCCPKQGFETLTEENFKTLLTVEDVEGVLLAQVPLTTEFYDYKEMAESVDPEQVADIDSFYGLSFQTDDGMKAITLAAIDFDSQASAQNHFENVTQGMHVMDPPLGDASAEVELNAQGIGSMVVFIKGDKVIQLHTGQPDGEQALTDLEGLENLAEIVAQKL